jgi:hypothetical protein
VRALAVYDDGGGPDLYVAGELTSVGGVGVQGIARWDGQSWSPVGGGIQGDVHALLVHDDGSGSALFAAGNFVQAGGVTVNHVARWDGNAWSDLAGGVTPGSSVDGVWSLAEHDDGGGPTLVAGGNFTIGSTIRFVARWDGASWSDVGGGLDGSVRALAVHDDGSGPKLYAGGFLGGSTRVARLDGSAWTALGLPVTPGMESVLALVDWPSGLPTGQALIVGGDIDVVPGGHGRGIALWRGGQWSLFGADQKGLNAGVSDLELYDDGSGLGLYAAGGFWGTADGDVAKLARWTGSAWVEVPGVAAAMPYEWPVDVEARVGPGSVAPGLYVVTGYPSSLYRWDGVTWTPLGDVPGGQWDGGSYVAELFDDGSGGGEHLFVGGDLGTPMSQWGIVAWDGTSWSTPGGGVLGVVKALAVFDDGSGPALYVGGYFGNAGGLAGTVSLARWDGQSWSSVGGGVAGGTVEALAVFDDGSGPALYVGGEFDQAGGQPADRLARWNGQAWTEVGGGVSGTDAFVAVDALASFDPGGQPVLVVGGHFTRVGSTPARNLATWDGASWSELGGGIGGTPGTILQVPGGVLAGLWVAGGFSSAGTHASWNVAWWREPCACTPSTYCVAKVNSQGCTPQMSWSGEPSASDPTPFLVEGAQVVNQKNGLLFYGVSGPASIPFQGGTLCVTGGVKRTAVQSSGGNPPPDDCSGVFSMDFNARIQGGKDPALVPGVQVWAQYWYRDPASPSTTGLSGGITFRICP